MLLVVLVIMLLLQETMLQVQDPLNPLFQNRCTNVPFKLNRLGHPSDQVLMILKNVIGIGNVFDSSPCEVCHEAKQTMEPFPLSEHKTYSLGEIIHLDVWGPYKVRSMEGYRYFLTVVMTFLELCGIFAKNDATLGGNCDSGLGSNASDKQAYLEGKEFDNFGQQFGNSDQFENTSHLPENLVDVRRSSRMSGLPAKFSDFVLDDKVSNLTFEIYVFTTSLNKISEPRTFLEAYSNS
ncbi:hypothetical protein Tco_1001580 [Tanacetum coccineum]